MSTITEPEAPEALPEHERSILAAYRQAHAMPDDARARVRHRLRHGVALAPHRDASRRRRAWGIGLGLAAAAGLILLLASTRETRSTHDATGDAREQAPYVGEDEATQGRAVPRSNAASRRDPVVAPPSVPADPPPMPVANEAGAPAPALTRPSPPTPRPDPRRPLPSHPAMVTPEPSSAPPEPAPSSPLAQEREILARAWAALARGDDDDAIAIAHSHAERFDAPILGVERRAIERIAACHAHRPGWSAGAAKFLAEHGQVPLASKVRDACGLAEAHGEPR